MGTGGENEGESGRRDEGEPVGSDRLAGYRGKRDPARTPEPVPTSPGGDGGAEAGGSGGARFVVQEHHASSLHWDLRLERDGVLVSWAVPKGIPLDPATNRLAVHTEDHPMEYAAFEGRIPKGEYGAGQMTIWDQGRYETEKWSDREVKVVFHGSRVSGLYVLFRTGGRNGANWMIHRMDPPADPDAEPLPAGLPAMLPERRARLPRDQDRYGFEFAWGGRRLLAAIEGGRAGFTGARGRAAKAPAGLAAPLGAALGARPALLDGELAEVDGRQIYMVFDLLHLDGRPLLGRPYEERRRLLDGLNLDGPHRRTAPWFPGEGTAVRDTARDRGLPGILAKRLGSRYEPGEESGAWRYLPV